MCFIDLAHWPFIVRLGALLFALSAAMPALAQGADEGMVVIKAGRVITVSGEEFAPGIVVIEDGRITGVGSGIEYPKSARVIRAPRETVMPGFIHPRTRHGLRGYNRSGVHGDWNASSEVYLSQMDFDDLLAAGYTSVCFMPDGRDVAGVASVYRTAGADEVRKLSENAYLRISPEWGAKGKESLRGALKKAKEEIEKVEKARQEWEKKQKEKAEKEKAKEGEEEKEEEKKEKSESEPAAEPTAKLPPDQLPAAEEKKEEKFEPPAIDPKYQPLVDLIQHKDGSQMLVELEKASDLHHLDDVLELYEDLRYVLYLATAQSSDYHYITEELGKRTAKLAIRPWLHLLPHTTTRYNLIDDLSEAGAEVSTVPWADQRDEYHDVRLRLAELIRSGLSREAALKSLTLHPANLLGLGKRLGSIEKEKEADLVFLSGDPFAPGTEVRRVMILGEMVWEAKQETQN